MRARAAAAVAVALAAFALAPSAARAEDLPPGRIAIVGGLRHGTGAVADDIGLGWSFGVEASWQPMSVGQRLGYGVSWSLHWAWFGEQPAARITGSLDMIQADVAFRVRLAPTPAPGRCLTLGFGVGLLRGNERLPPHDKRSYAGAFGEIGYEHLAFGSFTATLHVRLGPIATGPTIVSGLLGIGVAL